MVRAGELRREWVAAGPQTLAQAIGRAQAYLLGRQSAAGFWVGELQADASVTAGYGPLMYFMRGAVPSEQQRKMVNTLRSWQAPEGFWSAFDGGPGDLNVSIQAYLALKLAGVPAWEPHMQRARDFILCQGGIGRANVFTRIWLALFGQCDWRLTPSLPPEIMLLPERFPLTIYDFASWSRATIVALAIVLTRKPVCRLPGWAHVGELYLEPPGQRVCPLARAGRLFSWRRLFLLADSALKLYERLPWQPGRAAALRRAARWVEAHQEADGSWGGIMLPWVYSLIALKALGYGLDHPVIARGMAGLDGCLVEDGDTLRLQPATSPVWDTAWAVLALAESGLGSEHPALVRAARWLLGQEVRVAGDWRVKNPRLEPGCWAFEFENDLYPDLDDTAVVARALARVRLSAGEEAAKEQGIGRGLRWVLGMQGRDGGWAAFDRDNDKQLLAHVPFADFMSPLDPACADVTAHVIELLRERAADGPALARALSYLERTQEPDGAWFGRWGVNYLYGTGLVLAAQGATGRAAARAVEWLLSHQNGDGGWGETCQSYADPGLRGLGPSTPSQTAWALLGLMASGAVESPAVRAGVEYLLSRQDADGAWTEPAYTGAGFPRAFYLRYDLYRVYFPLLALARYRASRER